MTALKRVTQRVNRFGDINSARTPTPLLTLEEFFEGNDVVGSIGCNLEGQPTPQELYDLFKSIAAKAEVKDIRVVITMFDDPEWPFSDKVLIMTSGSPDQVRSWFPDRLAPDEVGMDSLERYEPYSLPEGTQPIVCWWD